LETSILDLRQRRTPTRFDDSLSVGQEIETTALWLDPSDWTLKSLRQIYRLKSERVLAYRSPRHNYLADITVDAFGVVVEYPGLWSVIGVEANASTSELNPYSLAPGLR
jgi:hypothetical protein